MRQLANAHLTLQSGNERQKKMFRDQPWAVSNITNGLRAMPQRVSLGEFEGPVQKRCLQSRTIDARSTN